MSEGLLNTINKGGVAEMSLRFFVYISIRNKQGKVGSQTKNDTIYKKRMLT
jgi:hypothetical protein